MSTTIEQPHGTDEVATRRRAWPGWPGGDGPDAASAAAQAGAGGEVFALAQQAACEQLAVLIGRSAACRAVGLPRSSWYRHNRISAAPARPEPIPHAERVQPRALAPAERVRVRELLNSLFRPGSTRSATPASSPASFSTGTTTNTATPASAYTPPTSVHFGTAHEIQRERSRVLAEGYAAHPERFVTGNPEPPTPPETVWINRPTDPEAPTNPTQ